jgi:hypothetical protein
MRADMTRQRYISEEFASYLMTGRPVMSHRESISAVASNPATGSRLIRSIYQTLRSPHAGGGLLRAGATLDDPNHVENALGATGDVPISRTVSRRTDG